MIVITVTRVVSNTFQGWIVTAFHKDDTRQEIGRFAEDRDAKAKGKAMKAARDAKAKLVASGIPKEQIKIRARDTASPGQR